MQIRKAQTEQLRCSPSHPGSESTEPGQDSCHHSQQYQSHKTFPYVSGHFDRILNFHMKPEKILAQEDHTTVYETALSVHSRCQIAFHGNSNEWDVA